MCWERRFVDNGVVQISVIEVFFLVDFLAFFDSMVVCADFVEVPTAKCEAVDASWGPPTAANVNFGDDLNDSVISGISVISVWHVGSMLIQPGKCRNTISLLYVKRLRRWKDNVNVIFRDDKTDSVISVINVISVCHVGSMLIQPGKCRIQYYSCMLKDNAVGTIALTLSSAMR